MAIEKKVDQDDLLSKVRIKETLLFGLIVIAAVFANLPHETLEDMGINQGYLLALLLCGVVVGLFFYLKFFFFLAVVLLIAGANMPAQIADGLGVSKAPIIIALVAMVGMALVNTLVKLMPTGLEPRPRERSPEGVRAMFYAIEKGNLVYAQKVLAMNFDPNVMHDNGYTPLAYAAAKGHLQMVELFLRNGADPRVATKDGDTPVELALRFSHTEVADLLKRARIEMEAGSTGAQPQPAGA